MSRQPAMLVIGGANIDLVATVPRSPKPGESLFGSSFKIVPGGKGANQAVAAARLGARTWFAGCVGDDAFGAQLRGTLNVAGIDTACLKTHASDPTGTALIMVAETGQNSIVVVPSANLGLTPEDIFAMRPVYEQVDAMLIQLELRLDTVGAALEMARQCGVLSILDAGPAQALSPEMLAKADIVSPNETEVEAITGVAVADLADAATAARRLRSMGAPECVLKLGAQGAFHAGPACADGLHAPAFQVTPVDTTAAGDAFTAALGIAWRRMEPARAMRFANAAGALAATVAGAQPSMPSLDAVRAFLQEKGERLFE